MPGMGKSVLDIISHLIFTYTQKTYNVKLLLSFLEMREWKLHSAYGT